MRDGGKQPRIQENMMSYLSNNRGLVRETLLDDSQLDEAGSRFLIIKRIVLTVIVLWFVAAISPNWRPTSDSALYLMLGQNLARGEGYELFGRPHAAVPPGYPLMLAALDRAGFGSMLALNSVMGLLGLASVWLSYCLVRELTSKTAAWLVASLVGLNALVHLISARQLSDMPFTVLVLAGLLGAVRGLRGQKWMLELGVLAIVASCWVRMTGFALAGACTLGVLLQARSGMRLRVTANAVALIAGVSLTLGAYWTRYQSSLHFDDSSAVAARGEQTLPTPHAGPTNVAAPPTSAASLPARFGPAAFVGQIMEFAAIGAASSASTLVASSAPPATAPIATAPSHTVQPAAALPSAPGKDELTGTESNPPTPVSYMSMIQGLLANPGELLKNGYRSGPLFPEFLTGQALHPVAAHVLFVLPILIGLWRGLARGQYLAVLAVAGYTCGVALIMPAESRYLLPVAPLLILYFLVGVSTILSWRPVTRPWTSRVLLGVVVALVSVNAVKGTAALFKTRHLVAARAKDLGFASMLLRQNARPGERFVSSDKEREISYLSGVPFIELDRDALMASRTPDEYLRFLYCNCGLRLVVISDKYRRTMPDIGVFEPVLADRRLFEPVQEAGPYRLYRFHAPPPLAAAAVARPTASASFRSVSVR